MVVRAMKIISLLIFLLHICDCIKNKEGILLHMEGKNKKIIISYKILKF